MHPRNRISTRASAEPRRQYSPMQAREARVVSLRNRDHRRVRNLQSSNTRN